MKGSTYTRDFCSCSLEQDLVINFGKHFQASGKNYLKKVVRVSHHGPLVQPSKSCSNIGDYSNTCGEPLPWFSKRANHFLIENGPQEESNFLLSVISKVEIRTITTTSYHPETGLRAQHFKRSIVTHLRYYVVKHKRSWSTFLQSLTNANNAKVRWIANI